MAKIYAPNKNYNGISASVTFVNGEGQTDDPHLISWFKQKGYKVVEDNSTNQTNNPPNPLSGKTKEELIAYAEEKGYKINKSCGKEKLIEAILAAEAEGKENINPEDDPEKTE